MCTSQTRPHRHRPPTSLFRRSCAGLAALLAVLLLLTGGTAGAQASTAPSPANPDNPGFTITPYSEGNLSGTSTRSAFVIDAKPGQTVTDRISVFNFTADPITFSLYPADAVLGKGTGTFSLQLPDPETGAMPVPTGVGKWITVPVDGLTAQPGTRSDIPITVSVPLDAEPGDHAGGIVALNTKAREGTGNLKVDIKQAVGVRMYVRVAGPLNPELTVSNLHVSTGGQAWLAPVTGPPKTTARFTITNAGNVRLSPSVKVRVKDLFGRVVASEDVGRLQELLPGASVDATAKLGDLSGFGPRYTVEVTTASDGTTATTATSSVAFWVVPWLLLLVLMLAIAAFVVRWRRRRRSAGSPGDGTGSADPREPGPTPGGPASAARGGDLAGVSAGGDGGPEEGAG